MHNRKCKIARVPKENALFIKVQPKRRPLVHNEDLGP